MTSLTVAALVVAILLVLLILRVPIAIALLVSSLAGIGILRGFDTLWLVSAKLPYDFAAHWSLSAIPMFLLMGAIAYRGGLTASLFEACRIWLSWLPGGLAVSANFASAMFAAASGSSLATAAAMGKMAVPEMLQRGYSQSLATGVVAASGTIGAMIPPSVAFIVYGWYTGQPIGMLLMAGVLPGLLTAFVYTLVIIIRVKMDPSLAPPCTEKYSLKDMFGALIAIWPVPLLIISVMGFIYSGITTATEAGAIGAASAVLICICRGTLTWSVLKESVFDTITSGASILLIAVGASVLSKFLMLAGVPQMMGGFINDFSISPATVIIFTIILYLILGMFLDPIGVMLVTLPILLPVFDAANMNLIWMGVLVVKLIEVGLLTPPVGLNVYVVKSVVSSDIRVETIFKGVIWFLVAEIFIIAALVYFPQISLFIPSLM
ncbi:TRAP transporter large permease [Marinobacter sp. F3R11]|uniref:TRAP transporter large permease n=1 Tax=Marinobacter sp. F3R11 TaxID=2267231 RepID=UPI000DE8A787|nr:TRAP transporter large permease [Marinobacter sp. F3R11]RBW51213.1 TRAP transporter large permease [Marinobacter sp. F3R11]